MKLRMLTVLLVVAASAAQAEDSPLVLNQRFQLHYNQWQSSQAPTTSTTQAVYEVEAGLPVFTYRLGAIAFNGAVEYNRLAYASEADSQTGLSRYGVRVSLFPYRPFRINLDYQHSQSPDLFDSGRVIGDTWGGGIAYGGRTLQDVRLSYRRGESRLGELSDGWSLWKLESYQRVGSTSVQLQASRQEFKAFGADQAWRLFVANLDTASHIGREWVLRTRGQAQDNDNSRWFDLGATFYGPISGAWHSLTTLSSGASNAGNYRTANTFASESVVYAAGRWNTHASGAYSDSSTRDLGQGTRVGSGSLGAAYGLGQDWQIHGDVGVSRVRQIFAFEDKARTTTTMNLGVARGGDVPELIRHTLFFLSDWTFDRRVREEYPPEFVPSELAQDMLRRRMRQTGSFGFTADLWRMSDNLNHGRLDWARVTGQVQTRGAFTLYLAGDYKNDVDMALPGMNSRNANLVANSSYRLGESSLTASLGYSSTKMRLTPGATTYGYAWMGTPVDGQNRHFSLGMVSRIGKLPIGVLVLRYEPPLLSPTTSVNAWADLSFRQVSLRLRYEVSRMDNGFRSSRISMDLLRWFDTVSTGSRR